MDVWFAYGSLAVALIVIWFMPKHLTRREIYLVWGFVAGITVYTDLVCGVVFDLYDFFESGKIDLVDLPLQATLAPSISVIFANFMPKALGRRFLYYLIGVVLFSCFFEWMSVLSQYLIYKGWKLYYSVPFYAVGMLYLRWHVGYLRKPT
ncbi:CBO0543 family protein [Paenibacillus silvisoli]|uniref:CBO0543 family protein n=1 Tax=Paenibacillus silvisoli TaxID=3110539 RepID=UPI00280402BE|nr:CBO0543 family protein [Paenibacillus silvisoli]